MINIKDINWESKFTSPGNVFGHIGNNTFVLVTFTGTHWYIHPLHDLIPVHGNEGRAKWGLFEDLELAKTKATEIIKESILSVIDMRDYKLNELTND